LSVFDLQVFLLTLQETQIIEPRTPLLQTITWVATCLLEQQVEGYSFAAREGQRKESA